MNEYLAALVDELHVLGVRDAVFSPGSRCTPLAMLFQDYGAYNTYMNVDERSAGFFALGIAKAKQQPVVLVCTSGSAMTHYYPVLIEAKHSGVPLIVLTADRPPSLQNVGAPQTIDQQKLFGNAVNFYEELSVPNDTNYYTYPRQVGQRAFLKAMSTKPGPVHINVPLEEPLVPELDDVHYMGGQIGPSFQLFIGHMAMDNTTALVPYLQDKKVLILAGPNSGMNAADSIVQLAKRLKAPILADPLSNVRCLDSDYIIDSYDAFLASDEVKHQLAPDCVIQLGQMVVSKRVHQFLSTLNGVDYIQVDPNGDYRNSTLSTTIHVQAHIESFVNQLEIVNQDVTYSEDWVQYNRQARELLNRVINEETLFEGKIVTLLQDNLPTGAQIVTANSMSIRDMDYFWRSGVSDAVVYGNRGTNGIDGTISTALGVSTTGKPTVLLTGDLSFFHDMNGLAMGKTHGLNLTIVVNNNDGGGIFEYLPQKGTTYFNYLFSTEQGLDYSGLETLYGITYHRIASYDEFTEALSSSLQRSGIQIIEVPTNKELSRQLHKKYLNP